MATLGSGRIVFSPEPQENVMTTAMIVTEAPYNDEESENRINMTENIMNKTETIFFCKLKVEYRFGPIYLYANCL